VEIEVVAIGNGRLAAKLSREARVAAVADLGVNSESVCDQAGDFKEPKAKHRAIAQISDTRVQTPISLAP